MYRISSTCPIMRVYGKTPYSSTVGITCPNDSNSEKHNPCAHPTLFKTTDLCLKQSIRIFEGMLNPKQKAQSKCPKLPLGRGHDM